MNRTLAIIVAAVSAAGAAAQLQVRPAGNQPPPPAAKPRPALQGAQRVQFILRQLDLTPDQQRHADGLVETYYGAAEARTIDIDMIRALAKQMEDAQKAGNTAEYDKLQQQLRDIGQGSQDEPEFLDNLRSVLTEAQKAELTDVLERLKANPSGALRAVDVVREARRQKLSDKQAADLDAAISAHRARVNDASGPRDATPAEMKLARQLDEFIAAVRAILTPEQATAFDARIARLKPEPPPSAVP